MYRTGKPTEPPLGYQAASGVLEPSDTVGGFLARHDTVRGQCQSQDCKRTCHINLPLLAARGLAAMQISVIKQLWRCHALGDCSLDFRVESGPGLPLEALLGRPHVSIRWKCRGCKFFRTSLPDRVIASLEAKKLGGGGTPIRDLGKLIKGPCQACGKSNWDIDVLWPNTESVGYRIDEQRRQEERAALAIAAEALKRRD